jgi:DNA-binding beta-propeller fold protein YncE
MVKKSMKQKTAKFFILTLFAVGLAFVGSMGCSSGSNKDHLLFPSIVVIDSSLNRVFVIDNQQNGMNLIDPNTNSVVLFGPHHKDSLLNNTDPQLLPSFPNDAALFSLSGGISRIFVVGGGSPTPLNQVVVLDFDDVNGIGTAPFSPITVAGSSLDTLLGLAVNPTLGKIFVSDASSGQVHVYNVLDGSEDPNSPIAIPGIPGRMSLDPVTGLLAVANSGNNLVSFIDTNDLTLPVVDLDVGIPTRDVAVASNASGSVLFLSGSMENTAQAYLLNLADLTTSSLLFQISPPPPVGPPPSPDFVTGNLNQVSAGNLTDGRMAGFFTQSSGDLLVFDLTSDLTSLTPAIVSVGAVSGEGLDLLLNSGDIATTVYFASPGVGTLTVVNPLNNSFTDQIQ